MRTRHFNSEFPIIIIIFLSFMLDKGTFAHQLGRKRIPMSIYISDPLAYTERFYLIFDNISHTFIFMNYGQGYDGIARYIGKWHLSGDTVIATPYLGTYQSPKGNISCDTFPFVYEPGDTVVADFKYLIRDSCLLDIQDKHVISGKEMTPSYFPHRLIHGKRIQDFRKDKD